MGTLLITVNDIKTLTDIPNNLDDGKLKNHMRHAQDVTLEKVIRATCLDELITAKDADTLTANQTTLINDYIVPYMANLVYWLALPSLWVTISNTGLQTKSGENFESIGKGDMHVLQKMVEGRVAEYQDRLLCYLNNNTDLFPCFNECGDCETPIVSSEPSTFVFRKGVNRYRSEYDN